jgi:TolB-like protein/DNA-binding winged helix-turn-helix (wHTH) protein/tetratricopeptide (TPR) repeat protein
MSSVSLTTQGLLHSPALAAKSQLRHSEITVQVVDLTADLFGRDRLPHYLTAVLWGVQNMSPPGRVLPNTTMEAENPTYMQATFGPYVIDLCSGELRKHGTKLKLGEQPLQILILLLQREGGLVTRDELQTKLWANHTFVDFDRSLNSAVQRLRDSLSDTAEKARWIETVPRRGYRFAGQVDWSDASASRSVPPKLPRRRETPVDSASPAFGMEFSPAAGHTTAAGMESAGELVKSPRASGILRYMLPARRRLVSAVVAGVALIAISYTIFRHRRIDATAPKIKSIAVLPVKNLSGDPAQEYLADGMTEELIGRLASIRDLRVISRTSVMQFKDTRQPVPEIAKTLGVDALVEGSVIRDGNRIRVHAQLIRAATDDHFWSESYDRELGDVLALESDVAESIAQRIDVSVSGQERSRVVTARHVSPEAYEAYLKGRYYWNKRTADGLQKGAFYFEQAIEKDPTYSVAYSGLADCNSGLAWHGFVSPGEALPKAYAAALKAIELDPQSSEAHASLGLVLDHRWEWDRAESEFRRALELRPQYANAHHWYGDNLSIRGRHEEAVAEAKQALELDPLNLMIGSWVGLRYYLAGQYDRAIEQTRATTDLDPNFAAAHLVLGESYLRNGLHEQALSELERAVRLSGDSPIYIAQLGMANANAGKKSDAYRIIAQLKEMSKERYVSPYGLAQIYAALNDKDQTFKWLDAACDDRSVWMSYLAFDPVFKHYRSDQRFQKLLHRAGLAT